MLLTLSVIGIVGLLLTVFLAIFRNAVGVKMSGKAVLGIGILSLLLSLSNFVAFTANQGYQYIIIYPWGSKDVVSTEGMHFAPFATTIQEWTKFIDIKTIDNKIVAVKDSEGNEIQQSQNHELAHQNELAVNELEGVMSPIEIRFVDQVRGTMKTSIRFELPSDPQTFIKFAVKYRNVNNLVHNTLIPGISEQAKNTGSMMSAQSYVSGGAQSFKQTFEEQLTNGAYVVRQTERKDTIYESISDQKSRRIREVQTHYSVEKVLDPVTHQPKIIPNEIKESGVLVSQVIVDEVKPDPEYEKRLADQKAESAKRQLEQQQIETAKISQQKIIAEGERDKAKERVDQEKLQVSKLIAIETELKEQATRQQIAEVALKTQRIESEKFLVEQRTIAEANRLKVVAGMTPQEKAEFENKKAIGVAAEIAKLQLPSTVVLTGESKGGGSDGLLSQLLGAKLAENLGIVDKKGN